jgi:hypothetical protein
LRLAGAVRAPHPSERPWACLFQEEGNTYMRVNLKRGVGVLAVALGICISGGAVRAVAAPFFQDHGQDYSKNKTYQQGMREGQDDRTHNKDHSRNRHFKKDTDQKAYEAGYQKGRRN